MANSTVASDIITDADTTNIETFIDVDMTSAADIETQPISWLWPSFLPIGTVSILFGEGGEGKSFATIALAGCRYRSHSTV